MSQYCQYFTDFFLFSDIMHLMSLISNSLNHPPYRCQFRGFKPLHSSFQLGPLGPGRGETDFLMLQFAKIKRKRKLLSLLLALIFFKSTIWSSFQSSQVGWIKVSIRLSRLCHASLRYKASSSSWSGPKSLYCSLVRQ